MKARKERKLLCKKAKKDKKLIPQAAAAKKKVKTLIHKEIGRAHV